MRANYPDFIAELEKTDPKLFEAVAEIFELAMSPGELDARTKLLIVLSLDALAGAKGGVKAVSNILRHMGTTDGQIAEALRLAYFVAGNSVLGTFDAAYEK